VGLGGAAIFFAMLLPRGLWGTLEERTGLRFMPLGYRLRRSSPPPTEDPA
jgi:branched-chain amino acid transport system permease protein